MRILYIANIPTPYKNDFYNELGKSVELTVIFEAMGASNQGIRFNWNISQVKNYEAVFLKEGDIEEQKLNPAIFKYLKEKWDCIFVTNYSYRTEMAAIFYLKMHRIPYVMEVDGGSIKKENILKKLIKKKLISGAQLYFSPSKQTDEFLKFYGASKFKIRRNPFTSLCKKQILDEPISDKQKKQIRNELGLVNSYANIVIGVGQLIPRKGWDCLLSIANKIDAEIIILGEGEFRETYEKQIREQKLNNVRLLGFMSNEVTTKYYRASDIFVLPTNYDVWGLVINEALANALPVITTEGCTSGNELIKNDSNGYIIPINDEEQLLSKIQVLLSNKKKREKMASNALMSIQSYTIENMAVEHLKYINSTNKGNI